MIRFPQVALTNRGIGHKCGTAMLDEGGMVRPTSMLPARNNPLHSQPSRTQPPDPSRSTALDRIEPERGQVCDNAFHPEGSQV